MIRGVQVGLKMASGDVIKRLETRAVAAEQLIKMLRAQIQEIKSFSTNQNSSGSNEEKEIESLTIENANLKKKIMEQKNLLISAEAKMGIKQVQTGNDLSQKTSKNETPKVAEEPRTQHNEDKNTSEKKPEKKKKEKAEKKPQVPMEEAKVDVGRLDMRVGLIKTAKRHPDADSLYVEEVDVGEEKPRTVISGLVKFIPEDQMQNRKAILMCNLKPSKMRGIMSEAMVMCASTPDKVEILSPPEDSKPGDLVYVEGYERQPDAQLNPKKKIFEACAPDLKIDGNKIATYKGVPWTVNGKHCLSQTLIDVQIK